MRTDSLSFTMIFHILMSPWRSEEGKLLSPAQVLHAPFADATQPTAHRRVVRDDPRYRSLAHPVGALFPLLEDQHFAKDRLGSPSLRHVLSWSLCTSRS